MPNSLVNRTLSHPQYLLRVDHDPDSGSFFGRIIQLSEGKASSDAEESGEMIFSSFPQDSIEQAEKAAMDYYIQIRK